ncbi:hypothetical protein JB92DRAFT_2824830 [Gautieria morchelliformis]|nr:hypothetical protein JB92DRAFT_2824830 [Gautieria morchelliformis]
MCVGHDVGWDLKHLAMVNILDGGSTGRIAGAGMMDQWGKHAARPSHRDTAGGHNDGISTIRNTQGWTRTAISLWGHCMHEVCIEELALVGQCRGASGARPEGCIDEGRARPACAPHDLGGEHATDRVEMTLRGRRGITNVDGAEDDRGREGGVGRGGGCWTGRLGFRAMGKGRAAGGRRKEGGHYKYIARVIYNSIIGLIRQQA